MTAMNTASKLIRFYLRVCAIEEGPNGVLRLPPFQTTAVAAMARVEGERGDAVLAWVPLQDGLQLGLAEAEHQRVRQRLYEIAAAKLGGRVVRGEVAEGEVPVIDVALPCLDKRMSANRRAHWAVVNGEAEFAGFAQVMASGWLAAEREEMELPPLAWSFETGMRGSVARALLAPLLEYYRGGEGALPPWPPGADYKVEFAVTLDGHAAAGWYGLGSERTYDFFKSVSRMSMVVQAAFRRWLPVLWLNDGRMFDHAREAAALLGYASLPPLLARSRRNYTYDPVDAVSLKQALTRCGRKIQRQLQNWYPALLAMEHTEAEEMHPRWHSKWAAELTRYSKRIQILLANEAWLIDQLVNFAAGFAQRRGRSELAGTVRDARAIHGALDARLRRWWDGRQAQALIGLLLVEATSAFAASPVQLAVTLRRVDAGGKADAPIVLKASRAAAARQDRDAPQASEAA